MKPPIVDATWTDVELCAWGSLGRGTDGIAVEYVVIRPDRVDPCDTAEAAAALAASTGGTAARRIQITSVWHGLTEPAGDPSIVVAELERWRRDQPHPVNGWRPARWDSTVPPGGMVCAVPDRDTETGICGMPVESTPCNRHPLED